MLEIVLPEELGRSGVGRRDPKLDPLVLLTEVGRSGVS